MPRPNCAPEGVSLVAIRGRNLKSAVDSLPFDCIGCIAHFSADDECCGFTIPPDARPWFQRVGFTISPKEMDERAGRTAPFQLVLSCRSPEESATEALREGRRLDRRNAEFLAARVEGWTEELRAYFVKLVVEDNERQARQEAGRGRPKDGLPGAFAGYWGVMSRLMPWLVPSWRHVWRAECLFQVARRGLRAGAACQKVAGWYGVEETMLSNNVGSIFQKK